MSQLRHHDDELRELGVRVAVVVFQGGALALDQIRKAGLEWPVLVDASLGLYHDFGMERGAMRHIYGLSSWWVYLKLLSRGRRLRRPTGDVRQLGGNVLIDPDGVVRFHHVGTGPADRPTVAELLSAVASPSAPPRGIGSATLP